KPRRLLAGGRRRDGGPRRTPCGEAHEYENNTGLLPGSHSQVLKSKIPRKKTLRIQLEYPVRFSDAAVWFPSRPFARRTSGATRPRPSDSTPGACRTLGGPARCSRREVGS